MMNFRQQVLGVSLVVACCAMGLGCGSQESAVIEPTIGDGKADISEGVQTLGVLWFNEEVSGSLTNDRQFDAYSFGAKAGAVITIETTQKGSSKTLDNTLFLYGPALERKGPFGSAKIAMDNDSGWGKLAKIQNFKIEKDGYYLIVVGSPSGTARGNYRLTLVCSNQDCQWGALTPGSFLTDLQAKKIAQSLDDDCPDTYCGGDYTYYIQGLSCSTDSKICELIYRAIPYDEEMPFAADVLDGKDEASLKRAGNAGNGDFEGKLLRAIASTESDSPSAQIEISCKLSGYQSYAELVEDDDGFMILNDHFYTHFMDCVDAMTEALDGLYSFVTPEQQGKVLSALDNICPDTFCAGDYTFWMKSMNCSSKDSICEILLHAQPVEGMAQFTADVLEGKPQESLKTSGDKGNGEYIGKLLGPTALDGKEGLWMEISCKLSGYQSYADLVVRESDLLGAQLTEKFYQHFLDCVWATEALMGAL